MNILLLLLLQQLFCFIDIYIMSWIYVLSIIINYCIDEIDLNL